MTLASTITAASVSITPKGLPDCTLARDTEGTYTLTITGLTGLSDTPRDLTPEETQAGIVAAVPPTVTTADPRSLTLLAVRAIEVGMSIDLLVDDPPIGSDVPLKHHYLIANVARLVALAMMQLEPPS